LNDESEGGGGGNNGVERGMDKMSFVLVHAEREGEMEMEMIRQSNGVWMGLWRYGILYERRFCVYISLR